MATKTPTHNLLPTLNTFVRENALALSEGYITSFRAIFNLPTPSGLELFAANFTFKTRTFKALFLMRFGMKHFAAFNAMAEYAAIRKPHIRKEKRMFLPEFIICIAMAFPAKSFKIIKGVRLFIRSKQAKRYFVIYCQYRWFMAMFTQTFSSLQNQGFLRLPIWPPITTMTTTPSRILFTCERPLFSTHDIIIA